MAIYEVKADIETLTTYVNEHFPQLNQGKEAYFIDEINPGNAVLRLEPDERHIRLGGTISGSTLFTIADYAAFIAVMGAIGTIGLTVTTNMNINFMRKAEMSTIICVAKILKLGKRLGVVDISISKAGDDELIAHGTATFSIPPSS